MGEVIDFGAIAAKDWLSESEAAAYCGVARSTFCAHARSIGIEAQRWMRTSASPDPGAARRGRTERLRRSAADRHV